VGGLAGTGFLKGEQKEGRFIPEQHNDFIFTVVGEEGGLIGATIVLAAFGFFFWRVWLILIRAPDPFYKMVAGGIFAALFFHTFVNLAMLLKLLPVVGLWLPFMSYGGTALWLCLSCVGLLIGIRRRERPGMFA
jgi:rod shape determining protein RodA